MQLQSSIQFYISLSFGLNCKSSLDAIQPTSSPKQTTINTQFLRSFKITLESENTLYFYLDNWLIYPHASIQNFASHRLHQGKNLPDC